MGHSLRMAARWLLPETETEKSVALQKELAIPALVADILIRRGFSDAETAREFLSPSLSRLHDPFLMADMKPAVARLSRAIAQRERILLYGDYDVDGTTSIVVLKKAIELLGGCCEFHVPHRVKDGYGMRAEVIEEAARSGVQLIVSVDTGIRAGEVVRQASQLGIDVIVTDHHLPEAELPPALAVLNPNRADCGYPEKGLCGAGVALKLVQGVLREQGLDEARQAALLDSFLKIVAVATIADIVPLTGENRVIVRRGLAGLRRVKNTGLRALLEVAGLTEGISPSTHQIAFRLAPRINAAGRMASARDVIDLFLTEDEQRAKDLAQQLDTLNRERQETEAEIIEKVVQECEQSPFPEDCAALVFAQAGWHLGVVGIVASRLVEHFSRPVFVLSESRQDGFLQGSGRSIPAFHLLDALESMPELFVKFGGHRQAAGLTIAAEKVDEFREKFASYAQQCLTKEDLCPQFTVDAVAKFTDIHDRSVEQIFSLAPFGFGNPSPVFMSREVEVAGEPRAMKGGKHFTIPLRQQGRNLFFKAWNFADRIGLFRPGAKVDVLFHLDDDPYSKSRGYAGWTPTLKDARPHAVAPAM